MNIEEYREYCISKPGVSEGFPFDQNTLVFKVMGKMFALLPLNEEIPRANLKADPAWSLELREQHQQITPGFHMNKKHWNTIEFDGSLADSEIFHWVNHSYDLVVSKLPKRLREEVNQNK